MTGEKKTNELLELKNTIKKLDIYDKFKNLLLDFLGELIGGTLDEKFLLNLLEKLNLIKGEVQIYDIPQENKDIEFAYYHLSKAFLRYEQSRTFFLDNVKSDSIREKHPQMNWRPYFYIGLFEFFMCNTNENDIASIFGDKLVEFHEFFYNLILSDISEDYYESHTILYYFDCQMWKVLGKEFSKYIIAKIQNCIEKTDIEEFLKIYSNFNDILQISFCVDGLHLIQFLLNNLTIDQIFHFDISFFYYGKENIEVNECIRKVIIKLLPDYNVKSCNDPLFLLGFFDYLTKDDLEKLGEDPRVSILDLIFSNKSTELIGDPIEEQINYLEKRGINILELLLKELHKNDLELYSKLWKNYAWWLISTEDFKYLIEHEDFDFIENLFLMMHHVAEKYNKDPHDLYSGLALIPSKIRKNLKDLMKTKLLEIIKKKDMKTFVPLCAYDYLFIFNAEEIISMIKDPNISLLRLVLETFDKYEDEFFFYRESSYEFEQKFFDILRNIPKEDINLLVENLAKDPSSPKYTNLVIHKFVEKIWSRLPEILNSEYLIKKFVLSLSESVAYALDFSKELSFYYEILPRGFSADQIQWVVNVLNDSKPIEIKGAGGFFIKNSWFLPKAYDSLNWYDYFNPEQLKEILDNIRAKFSPVQDFEEFFPYIIAHLKDRIEEPNFKEVAELVSKASEGIDNFEKAAVGFMNYGFVFKNSVSRYFIFKGHRGKCCAAGSMRGFLENWAKKSELREKIESLEELKVRDDKLDLFLAGSLKTLIPGLRFGGDELLFDVWMLVKTPENKIFPANFYYAQSGVSIGGYGKDLTNFPKDLQTIVNSSVFELNKNELETFLDALEFALNKIPISDFKGIYKHDLGATVMGIIDGQPYFEEWY